MIITYHGLEFFRVQFGDTILAFNPISKNSKYKSAHFGADIALVTLADKDFNGIESVTHGEKTPFVVSGPGEYEIKEVFIKGTPSISNYGEKKLNTIYTVSLENMNICFLGALGSTEVSSEVIESLGEIDILFIPIGGEGVLKAGEAYKFAVTLEPKIIIPMQYGEVGDKNALKIFLKEGGEENLKPIDKLTVKKKDLEGKEGDIVVLESAS